MLLLTLPSYQPDLEGGGVRGSFSYRHLSLANWSSKSGAHDKIQTFILILIHYIGQTINLE